MRYILVIPIFFALLNIVGALFYYIMPLNWPVILGVATLSIALALKIITLSSESQNTSQPPNSQTVFLSIVLYLLPCILFGTLLYYSTSASIRSPWEVVPWWFTAIYFIATLILIARLSSYHRITVSSCTPLILFFILSFSIALFVYRVGYGYDQFIHQATERAIFNSGEILPKPPYYLGQYALVVILSKLTFIPVELLDRIFLPIFAGIFLPLIILWSLRKSSPSLPTLLFLALPFSSFMVTTPQGLANFFFVATILVSLPAIIKQQAKGIQIFARGLSEAGRNAPAIASDSRGARPVAPSLSRGQPSSAEENLNTLSAMLFALAALSIHPLAGIPAILFALATWGIYKGYIRTVSIGTIFATVALPATLLFSGFAAFKMPTSIALLPSFSWQPHFHALLDIAYTYTNNIGWLIVLVSAAAVIYLWRTMFTRAWLIYPISSAILFINAFLIKNFLIFPAVIGYEQGIFAARVYELARFAMMPLLLLAAPALIHRILNHPQRIVKLSWAMLLAIAITSSMYASYPHVDAYEWSKGYSVSAADQHAVESIHTDAKNSGYVVLSNQSVSAAAVQAYGFPTSYAIPTSSRLYQLYSDMVYIKPAAQTMREAMNQAKVDLGYFVINAYWTNAKEIMEAAKREAQSWWEVDEGKLTVFKYQR